MHRLAHVFVDEVPHINDIERLLLDNELAGCGVCVDEPTTSVTLRYDRRRRKEQLQAMFASDFGHISDRHVAWDNVVFFASRFHHFYFLYNQSKQFKWKQVS